MAKDGLLRKYACLLTRRRIVLALLILVAGLTGYWWLTRPQPMRLVSCQVINLTPSPDMSRLSATTYPCGFILCDEWYDLYANPLTLVQPQSRRVTFYDWDGQQVWQLRAPFKDTLLNIAKQGFDPDMSVSSISPDGRYYASSIFDGTAQRIMHWRDGKPLGTVRLPSSVARIRLMALDSGQVYCWLPDKPTGTIALIENGRLRANGTVPTPAMVGSWAPAGVLSPDGQAFATATARGFTYYRLAVSGSRLQITPVYTGKEPPVPKLDPRDGPRPHLPRIIDSRLLVAANGAIYNDRGKASGATGWYAWFGPRPSGTSVVQYRMIGVDKTGRIDIEVRVLDPRTGKAWKPDGQTDSLCFTTPDGGYLTTGRRMGIQRVRLAEAMLHWNGTPARLRSRLENVVRQKQNTMRLVVYQRPGQPRVYRPLYEQQREPSLFCIKTDENRYYGPICGQMLSPDGHTLHLLCIQRQKTGDGPYAILTYTW